MALFDDIKRTATDVADKAAKTTTSVADKVAKKANDLTAIAKLTMSIKSNESKLSAIYEEIGYLFYSAERNSVDNTEDIASQILKADEINAEIEALKKESSKLRNVTVCPSCGKEISNEASYCSYCGAFQEKPVEEPEECCCESDSEEAQENDTTEE